MSLTTGPYAIAGGGSLRIPLPRGTLVVDSVAVANLTPAPVVVTIAGTSKYVSPSGVDLFSCSSGQSYIQVTSTGTSTDAGSITTTWFDPADTPGHYPYAGAITKITTSGTITANITGPVTIASGTVDLAAGAKVGVTGDITLAAGTKVVTATGSVVSLAAGAKVGVTTSKIGTLPGTQVVAVGPTSAASLETSGAGTFTLIPAPASPTYLLLYGLQASATTATTKMTLLAGTGAVLFSRYFTSLPRTTSFNFSGRSLGAGVGVNVKSTAKLLSVVLTYSSA